MYKYYPYTLNDDSVIAKEASLVLYYLCVGFSLRERLSSVPQLDPSLMFSHRLEGVTKPRSLSERNPSVKGFTVTLASS